METAREVAKKRRRKKLHFGVNKKLTTNLAVLQPVRRTPPRDRTQQNELVRLKVRKLFVLKLEDSVKIAY